MVTRLFVVHGMGEFGAKWVDSLQKQLSATYAAYPKLASVPQAKRFTIHPIRYDDVLSDLVKKWQTDSTAISKLAAGVGAGTAEAMVGWLKSAGQGFEWTHAADVLLYRCFSDVREAILVTVANQMVKIINKDLNEFQDCRWGVLAHSLGTSVAHDALHSLWTSQFDNGAKFPPADVKAAFVMMVANVSRLLQTDVDVLDSVVQPGTGSAKDRGCLNFLTVRHALDPFTVPRKFDPVDWPDALTVEQGRYQSIRVQHFRERNVHGFGHYLQHPAVHIPLLRLLANKKSVISATEETAALAAFTDMGSLPKELVIAELKRLELLQPAQSDDWKVIRPIWDAFFGD